MAERLGLGDAGFMPFFTRKEVGGGVEGPLEHTRTLVKHHGKDDEWGIHCGREL